ncbi:Hsp70 family protein [Plantactinospora sonchi]|uniref:Hsp70 family protein n=1 Tax=Plantactinospora sonchi TaxID=1544735 RepID=A0ABU7RUP9_9ACTN
MSGAGARLGIDFGTYHTVAVLALPGREPRPMLFDGSPLLRSAVCADPDHRLLVGQDALHTGLSLPQSFEPHPKLCVDDRTVLLGEREVTVEDLFAAPLHRVASQARLVTTEPVTEAVLTFPAAWGTQRRTTLLTAARQVLPTVRLVAEPVAAAHFFVEVAGRDLPVGRCAVVYDFGAGTFDVTVVRRTGDGYEVLATEGLADCGGLDIDAAIVARLGTTIGGRDEPLWNRLSQPTTTSDRRARQQLWANVRAGKEMLSRSTSTMIHVPLFDLEMPLGREELEELAEPVVARTVETTRMVLARTEGAASALAAVFLSGGSSRMPAVASALHRALEIAPSVVEQPELVVAEGSLRTRSDGPAADTMHAGTMPTVHTQVDGPVPVGRLLPVGGPAGGPAAGTGARPTNAGSPVGWVAGAWRHRRARFVGVMVAAVGLLGAVTVTAALANGEEPGQGTKLLAGPLPSVSATASPTPVVTPSVTAAGVDSCLVGVWRAVSSQSINKIDGRDVQFSGDGGTIQTYTADGRVKLDFTKDKGDTATVNGVKWRQETRGTATANVYHRNGIEYVSSVRAKGTVTLYRGNSRNNRVPLTLILEPTEYICVGDTMRFFGNGSSEWVRVR